MSQPYGATVTEAGWECDILLTAEWEKSARRWASENETTPALEIDGLPADFEVLINGVSYRATEPVDGSET